MAEAILNCCSLTLRDGETTRCPHLHSHPHPHMHPTHPHTHPRPHTHLRRHTHRARQSSKSHPKAAGVRYVEPTAVKCCSLLVQALTCSYTSSTPGAPADMSAHAYSMGPLASRFNPHHVTLSLVTIISDFMTLTLALTLTLRLTRRREARPHRAAAARCRCRRWHVGPSSTCSWCFRRSRPQPPGPRLHYDVRAPLRSSRRRSSTGRGL